MTGSECAETMELLKKCRQNALFKTIVSQR